jgi:Protein of unknown function (DUF2970)
MSHEPSNNDLREAVARQGSFVQTLKAVFWSFFGVRKSSDHAQDVAKINPVHVIIAGVLGGVMFVLTLVLLVQWVVSGHGV